MVVNATINSGSSAQAKNLTITAAGAAGGQVSITGNVGQTAALGTLTISNTAASTVSSIIAGAGTNVVKQGGGTLTLSNAGSSYSGTLTVAEGTVSVSTWNNNNANGPLGNTPTRSNWAPPARWARCSTRARRATARPRCKGLNLNAGGGQVQQVFNGGDRGGNYVHINGSSITGSGGLTVDTKGGSATSRFIVIGSARTPGRPWWPPNSELQTNYYDTVERRHALRRRHQRQGFAGDGQRRRHPERL